MYDALLLSQIKGMSLKKILDTSKRSSFPEVEEDVTLQLLQACQIPPSQVEQAHIKKRQIEDFCQANNHWVLDYFDARYPEKLRCIDQPPLVLYGQGDLQCLKEPLSLAIVGTRKPSVYGQSVCLRLARELGQSQICIISGMARGIDACAHQGALASNARTVAVLGGPLHLPYPKSNRALIEKLVASKGLVISEYSPLEQVLPYQFAHRNRIISALAEGVLVIEAGLKSGTLITANYAADQGKAVFAIPGNIDSINSAGTNRLIRDGAQLVTCAQDILMEFGRELVIERESLPENLSPTEQDIYQAVAKQGVCHVETLCRLCALPIEQVTGIVTIMDIKGVLSSDGQMVSLR